MLPALPIIEVQPTELSIRASAVMIARPVGRSNSKPP
jgi:hypothetical protein